MILLAAILLKSLLVFAFAGLALLWLRRASAAARHLVCLLTLAALLALPALSLLLPGWKLPVAALPAPRPAPISVLPAPPDTPHPTGVVPLLPPSPQLGPLLTLPPTPAPLPPRPFPWLVVLPLLWLLGVLLASVRPLLGLWGIRCLSRLCEPITDAPTFALAQECAAALHLKRTPALRQADVSVPMTWGWRRPTVLLPLTAGAWSPDRCRAVLLHELAHVRRVDWLWHRLADVACALYWFHPGVWLLARRLRSEGEMACDDLVLSSGIAAPEYARHLLAIARALPPLSIVPQAAIGMAQTSRIEGRLTMILDPARSRRALTSRTLLLVLGLSAAALISLAVLRPDAHAQAAAPAASSQSAPSAYTIHLPTYGSQIVVAPRGNIPVQLIGLTSPKTLNWWDKTGRPLGELALGRESNSHTVDVTDPKQRSLLLAFRLPPSAQGITVKYTLTNSVCTSSDGTWQSKMQSTSRQTEAQLNAQTSGARILTATFPISVVKTDVRVGTASGPWKVIATAHHDTSGQSGVQLENAGYIFSPLTETKEGTVLTISANIALGPSANDLRIIAMDGQGHEVLPEQIGDISIGDSSIRALDQITARFALPPAQISEIRLESRPFRYVEFKSVPLQPAK